MADHTTVVVDFSVLSHQIHGVIAGDPSFPKEHFDGYLKAQIDHVVSLSWLPPRYLGTKGTQIVFVKDVKESQKYWRHDYLAQDWVSEAVLEYYQANVSKRRKKPQPIAYKSGRKFPKPLFHKIKKRLYELAEQKGIRSIGVLGYEADDLMATFAVLNSQLPAHQRHQIVLVTVDSDIMGLISPEVAWYCLHGYPPRTRHSMESVNLWYAGGRGVAGWINREAQSSSKKLLEKMDSGLVRGLSVASELWKVKHYVGDSSDSLPPGTPIEAINLLEPPVEHRLWLREGVKDIIEGYLLDPDNIPSNDSAFALDYLRRLGLRPAIRPFDAAMDDDPVFLEKSAA